MDPVAQEDQADQEVQEGIQAVIQAGPVAPEDQADQEVQEDFQVVIQVDPEDRVAQENQVVIQVDPVVQGDIQVDQEDIQVVQVNLNSFLNYFYNY